MHRSIKTIFSFLPLFLGFYRNLTFMLLLFFILAGVVFTVLMPAFRAPDEDEHWQSAISRINGDKSQCNVESSLSEHLKTQNLIGNRERSIDTGQFRKIDGLTATCHKSHVWYGNIFTYYGATIGTVATDHFVKFKKELSLGEIALLKYFSARFFQGFLLVCLLMHLLYRSWQEKSEILYPGTATLLSLTIFPLFLQQSYSVTSDTIVLAACIALVTVQSYRRKISSITLFIAVFLALQAMITKPVYAPAFVIWAIAAFLFELRDTHLSGKSLLPRLKNIGERSGLIFLLGMLLASSYVVWHFLTLPKSDAFFPSSSVNPAAQFVFIKSNVVDTISIITGSIAKYSSIEILWEPLGWFDFYLSSFVPEVWKRIFHVCFAIDICLITVLICGSLFHDRKSWKTLVGNLSIICTVLLGIYLSAVAISLSMYVYWTPVGASYVEGIQARYFLPLLILCFGLFKMIGKNLDLNVEKGELGPVAAKSAKICFSIVLLFLSLNTLYFLLSIVVNTLKRYY